MMINNYLPTINGITSYFPSDAPYMIELDPFTLDLDIYTRSALFTPSRLMQAFIHDGELDTESLSDIIYQIYNPKWTRIVNTLLTEYDLLVTQFSEQTRELEELGELFNTFNRGQKIEELKANSGNITKSNKRTGTVTTSDTSTLLNNLTDKIVNNASKKDTISSNETKTDSGNKSNTDYTSDYSRGLGSDTNYFLGSERVKQDGSNSGKGTTKLSTTNAITDNGTNTTYKTGNVKNTQENVTKYNNLTDVDNQSNNDTMQGNSNLQESNQNEQINQNKVIEITKTEGSSPIKTSQDLVRSEIMIAIDFVLADIIATDIVDKISGTMITSQY